MLMEGTPKVQLTPSDDHFLVWVTVPLEHVAARLEGLIPMPIAVYVRDEDRSVINKALKFTANSTILAFDSREDAEKVAAGLAHALETEVDYSEVDPPDEEIYYS